jgi:uncharacterized protein YciI
MAFFVYGRDHPGMEGVRTATTEEHWSYMDRYADVMIARGPTFVSEDEYTGSVHIVDLPDVAAAQAFAYAEPYYRAGVFADVMIRRWRNVLGRTMWQFAGRDLPRFLVLGHGAGVDGDPAGEGVIVWGPLLSDDGSERLGTAMLVEAADADAAAAHLPGGHDNVEVHRWRFGGRPT